MSGCDYTDVTMEDWYLKNVPTDLQTVVRNEASAIYSAASSVLGTPQSITGTTLATSISVQREQPSTYAFPSSATSSILTNSNAGLTKGAIAGITV